MMRTCLVLLAAAACGTRAPADPPSPGGPAARPAAAAAPRSIERPGLRLGDQVRPVRYAVDLTLVPEDDRFTGAVEVELAIRARTSAIVLHADELTVQSARLIAGGQEVAASVVPLPPDAVGFSLARPVEPGSARLRVTYSGRLRAGESDGLYVEEEAGRRYIYTQFEAQDARRAMPCFDDPGFKVPWSLTLHVKKEHRAFANTPMVSETDEPGGMKAVRFAASKPMPSYLVAFAVGPFEVVDAGVAGRNRTRIRIITPHGKADEARWAAEVTGPILERVEAYFDSGYPYEKLDSIAVPQKGGAMENAGLITYGSSLILGRPGVDGEARRRRYAEVAAHEIAHMWFGDLVTMAWWDDLWLNEAFASWLASRIVTDWKPAWGGEVDRVVDRAKAMNADSLVSARQIRQPIKSRDDIEAAFDGITYEKGQAVIVMFERWLGPEVFQRGVRRYMKTFAWGNATSGDFLAAISAEAGRDVAPAFSSFLEQPGLPLVEAALTCKAGLPPVVDLTQSRYLPAGSRGGADQRWQLPVCVAHPHGVECTLMSEARAALPLARAKGCPAWIQANAGMNGYYRVAYHGDLWARLLRAGWARQSAAERVGLFSDLHALVDSGRIPYGEALAQLAPRVGAADRHLLVTLIGIARGAGEILPADELRPAYAAWIRRTFGRRARALGWRVKGKDEEAALMRPKLLELVAVEGEDRALAAEAGRLARRWLDDRGAVHPDLVDAVLRTAAAHGDRALLERMVAAAGKAGDRHQRSRLFKAMGAFREPAAQRAALELVLSPEVDPREAGLLYSAALEDPRTRDAAWRFIAENADRIIERLPRWSGRRLVVTGSHLCDPAGRAEVEKVFAGREQNERLTRQALEKIDLCSARRQLQAASLRAFLRRGRGLRPPRVLPLEREPR